MTDSSDHSRYGISRRNALKISAAAMGSLALPHFPASANDMFRATSGETVYFRGWQFMPDVVVENVNRYNNTQAGNIDYQTITGDYPSLMEKAMIAKDRLDVIYGNPPTLVRFMEAGWLDAADDLPNAEAAKADMYDSVRDMWTYKGKLLGLSYFIATRGMVAVNRLRQAELGISDDQLPKTWDEFYAQLDDLTAQGHKDLYMPHWFNEYYGMNWSFLFELLNRGGRVIDPQTHLPDVSVDGPAGALLNAWKKAWQAGQIPEEVLSYTEANIVDGFASGRYLYTACAHYNIAYFNNPEKSRIAGHVGFLPYRGQSWGLIDSALYVKTKRTRSPELEEDVKKFVSWYGYKDDTGEVAIGSRWVKEAMLFSGYRSVMEAPETKAHMASVLARPEDVDELLTILEHTPAPVDIWGTVFAEEFGAWLRRRLPQFLINDEPTERFIGEIADQVLAMNKKYKIK